MLVNHKKVAENSTTFATFKFNFYLRKQRQIRTIAQMPKSTAKTTAKTISAAIFSIKVDAKTAPIIKPIIAASKPPKIAGTAAAQLTSEHEHEL